MVLVWIRLLEGTNKISINFVTSVILVGALTIVRVVRGSEKCC
jgi:hypothetical protein